jgi:hypothetical protein
MRIAAISVVTIATVLTVLAENPARIYVYAQRGTAARAWRQISCNGEVVAELKQGSFFAINVVPGRYIVSVDEGVPISVDVRAGEQVFVRLDWDYGLDRPPIPQLSKVYLAGAQQEIKYLGYVDAKRVHSLWCRGMTRPKPSRRVCIPGMSRFFS